MTTKPRYKFNPGNEAQKQVIESFSNNHIIFCIGPPGGGKTHAALALGKQFTDSKRFSKIVVARPTVGAGETNGFLPGTLADKLAPFMAPVYDICETLYGNTGVPGFMEICSFEHLRGRTFHDTIMILDEASNCTFAQLELAVSRMGLDSKIIICGDPGQSDIGLRAGLMEYISVVEDIAGVDVIRFTESDNMRHDLVAKISRKISKYKAEKCNQLQQNANTP